MTDPIEYIARFLAVKVKQWDPENSSHIEDIRYHLAVKISYYSVIVLCLIIGIVTGRLIDTVLSVYSFALLRRFSGGRHMKTLFGCLIVSVTLLSSIPHIAIVITSSIWINIICIILVLIFSERREHYNIMGSIMLIGTNFILNSPVVAISFLAQSLLLIKLRR